MRRVAFGPRMARVARRGGGGMALILGLAAMAVAQAPPPEKGASAPDTAPLARYVPRQDLLFYAEFAGLDSRADAWRKTAAYKMLNQTTLGVMLEEVAAQVADAALASAPGVRLKGAEVVAIAEHLARCGFALGVCGRPGPQPPLAALVIRHASRDDARGLFNRLLNQFGGPDRPRSVIKAGGREVSVVDGPPGKAWAWWTEGDDLVIGLIRPESADAIIEALEGERPNAVDHPIRAELARAEGGFLPIGLAFADLTDLAAVMPPQAAQLGLTDIRRVDVRWGLQDDALMGVIGIKAPGPRRGLLGLFDQPTFDKGSLPPLPAGLADFTVVSIDLRGAFDRIVDLIQAVEPSARARIDAAEKAVRDATGRRLREDILGQIGPKMAFYIVPTKINAPTNAISGMVTPVLQVPKVVFRAEVRDPEAFGKALDDWVSWANRTSRDLMANPPRRLDGPLDELAGLPAAEFRPMPGPDKGYVLAVPPGLLPLPAGLRPAVMLGRNSLIVASSPEVAREALDRESKAGDRKALAGPLAQTLDRLPARMTFLSVSDPRESLFPELLANLPNLVQMIGMAATADRGGGPGVRRPVAPPVGGFRLRLDPDKVPAPDALRRHLFPGSFSVSVDDQGIRLTSREAFPTVSPVLASPVAAPAVMVALLLPAVQSAREAARRAQCVNNLKQIALAMHNHHAAMNHFPPAAIADKNGKPLLSWRVALLPYLEQENLYNQFHLDEPWDSPHNKQLIQSMPSVFACPSSKDKESFTTHYRVYKGEGAAFEGNEGRSIADFLDGTSNTLLVVEAPEAVPWTKPDDLPYDPDPDKALRPFAGKDHPGGFNAAFADGAVRFLKNSVNPQVLRALITRNGGEIVSSDAY